MWVPLTVFTPDALWVTPTSTGCLRSESFHNLPSAGQAAPHNTLPRSTMKFSLVAVAATFAVASAVDCDLTQVHPLLANTNVATCTENSGFSFVPPTKPTADTLTKICASAACKNVLAAVEALSLGDCTLLGLQLETDLIKPIQTACSGSSNGTATATAGSTAGSSAGNSSAGNSSAGATVGSTTPKATTTRSPASSAAADTVNTPATKTTPTPSPTSSASTAVIATGTAAIAAIAASFL